MFGILGTPQSTTGRLEFRKAVHIRVYYYYSSQMRHTELTAIVQNCQVFELWLPCVVRAVP